MSDPWRMVFVIHLIAHLVSVFPSAVRPSDSSTIAALLRCVQIPVTPWTVALQAPLSSPSFQSLLKFMSIESVILSNHLILCCPFSSCLQSFPASGSFPMSWLLASGGQSIGVSTSASVLPMNIQDWFPLGLTGLISLQSKGLSRAFSSTTVRKHQFLVFSLLYGPTLTSIQDYWKPIALTIWTFVGRVISLLFNMLSRCVIAFLPKSKCLLILWLQSPSTVILEPKKIKSVTDSIASHLFAMKWWDWKS